MHGREYVDNCREEAHAKHVNPPCNTAATTRTKQEQFGGNQKLLRTDDRQRGLKRLPPPQAWNTLSNGWLI
jgi:hypothetical protein